MHTLQFLFVNDCKWYSYAFIDNTTNCDIYLEMPSNVYSITDNDIDQFLNVSIDKKDKFRLLLTS